MPSAICSRAAPSSPCSAARAGCGRSARRPAAHTSNDDNRCRNGEQAVVELHRRDILEPIQDEGAELGIAGGDEPAVHQRKGVVGQPGAGTGDKPAGRLSSGRQRIATIRQRAASPDPGSARASPPHDAERDPEDRGVNRKRQSEMGDEPVLADLDPVGEPALDHVPAEHTLREAEQQNAGRAAAPAVAATVRAPETRQRARQRRHRSAGPAGDGNIPRNKCF